MARQLMNEAELISGLRAMHKPELIDNDGELVYEVWNDGEVTLTKAGGLYGQRNLHMVATGDAGLALPRDSLFPRFKYSRIVVGSYEEAMLARGLIFGEGPAKDRFAGGW